MIVWDWGRIVVLGGAYWILLGCFVWGFLAGALAYWLGYRRGVEAATQPPSFYDESVWDGPR